MAFKDEALNPLRQNGKIAKMRLVQYMYDEWITVGVLYIDGVPTYHTLQDYTPGREVTGKEPGSTGAITGTGYAFWDVYNKKARPAIRLNIPGKSGILIHAGNSFQDTLGCILIGRGFGVDSANDTYTLLNSNESVAELYGSFNKFDHTQTEITIEIVQDASFRKLTAPSKGGTPLTSSVKPLPDAATFYPIVDGKPNWEGYRKPSWITEDTLKKLKDVSIEQFFRFDEQYLLIKNAASLVNKPYTLSDASASYTYGTIGATNFAKLNVDRMNKQDVQGYISTLNTNTNNNIQNFLNISTKQAATLIPCFRLFKSYKDPISGAVTDYEIPLETKLNPMEAEQRNIGYGLKSFSWTDQAINNEDKSIAATMVMKFSSLDSLVKEREIAQKQKFSFLQLILAVDDVSKADTARVYKSSSNPFRVKVIIGWYGEVGLPPVVLYLYYKMHNVNIEKDGTVTFTVEFQAGADSEAKSLTHSNVLSTPGYRATINDAIQNAGYAEAELNRSAPAVTGSLVSSPQAAPSQAVVDAALTRIEHYSAILADYDKPIKMHRLFIDELLKSGGVRVATVNYSVLQDANRDPTQPITINELDRYRLFPIEQTKTWRGGVKIKSWSDYTKEELNIINIKNEIKNNESEGIFYIPFFQLGDLFDICLKNVNSGRSGLMDIIRFISGPIILDAQMTEVRSAHTNRPDSKIIINLADLPISLKKFLKWFNLNVIKQSRTNYRLIDFLNDILRDLVVNSLNVSSFGKRYSAGASTIDLTVLTSVSGLDVKGGNHSSKTFGDVNGATLWNTLPAAIQPFTTCDVANVPVYQYLYAQAKDMEYSKIDTAKYLELNLGKDIGIVKSISYTKDHNPGMAVANVMAAGSINPIILRTAYTAEIRTIGCPAMRPGMVVKVDPTYMSDGSYSKDIIEQLGITGYYWINKVSHTLMPGRFETTLSTRWVGNKKGTVI